MFQARYKVHKLIEFINHWLPPHHLIKLCLWEDKFGNQYVKVLDCANDLAKSVASRYQLVIGHEISEIKWPNKKWSEYCYAISLELNRTKDHRVNFECKKLAQLQLQRREDSQSIPIEFFEGMKELLVLSVDISSLPLIKYNVLRNIITLHIKVLLLEDMSWIGGLINLELLSISTSTLTDIPREMGKLGNLKLLDLREMNIAFIPPCVLSRMLKLEELYLPLRFNRWGCRAKEKHGDDYDDEQESWEKDNYGDEERINASLSEIVSVSLNTLQISVLEAFPKESPIFKNIQRFKILLPKILKYKPFGNDYANVLQLTGDASDIKDSGICDLLCKTEDLSLIRVRNLKNVMYQLEDYDFPHLKKMIISECGELECIVDTIEKRCQSQNHSLFWKLEYLHLSMLSSMKEIWHGRWKNFRWFENLNHISIRFCHKLKYVFPVSMVRGWILLQRIEILECNELMGIFYQDEEDDNSFSVEELDLHSLPNLVGFLIQKENQIVSNSIEESINTFDGNSLSLSTNESTSRLNESCINDTELVSSKQQVSLFKNNNAISHLERYYAFSSKLAGKWVQNLRKLKIAYCDALKVIFLFGENHVATAAFNALKELELFGLQNLMHIWFMLPPDLIAFQNLQLLVLSKCHNLCLFSARVAKLLVQLEKVCISCCEKMEEVIVVENEKEVEDLIVFPRLKLLEIQNMPNLRIFSSEIYAIELPLLESLKLNQCDKMESFSYGPVATPKLQRVHINGSLYSILGDLNATMKRYVGTGFGDPSINVANPGSVFIPNSPPTAGGGTWASQLFVGEEEDSNAQVLEAPNYMKEFTFVNLKSATKNFSSDCLLGEGDVSKVYKGWLDLKTSAPSRTTIGTAVAVKKLNSKSQLRLQEWETEVKVLERLSHPNVVKLLGHCLEDEELLIVYEFMQRGSLDNHIYEENTANETLSWDMRLKIAIEVAQGLDFLHTSENKVTHGDIKPSNILLDGNYNAKISDFRLAKWGDSNVITRQVLGTYDYAAPEYVEMGRLSVKSDVYSFGMMLTELMTGSRMSNENRRADLLARFLAPKVNSGSIANTRTTCENLMVQLALKCTLRHVKARPSMRDVVDELRHIAAVEEIPQTMD